MRSRSIRVTCVVALMAAANGAVIASGAGSGNGSASQAQYKPGCGPKKGGGTNPSGTHTGPPGLVGSVTTALLGGSTTSSSQTSPCPK